MLKLLHNYIKLLLSQTHSLFPLAYIFYLFFRENFQKNCKKKPMDFMLFMLFFLDIK